MGSTASTFGEWWSYIAASSRQFVGLEDLRRSSVWRSCVVEMVFVGLFVFMSIIVSIGSQIHFSSPIVPIAFFHFLILGILIRASLPPSDAHFNPAFTLCTIFTGRYSPFKGIMYITAQTLGAVFGALCAKTLLPVQDVHKHLLSGCTYRPTNEGLNIHQAFFSEFIFSWIFIYVCYMVAIDSKQFETTGLQFAPFFIGATAGLNIYVSRSIAPGYTGASMNPARCMGPAIAYGGSELLDSLWIYWCAPALAAIVVAGLYVAIPPNHRDPTSRIDELTPRKVSYSSSRRDNHELQMTSAMTNDPEHSSFRTD